MKILLLSLLIMFSLSLFANPIFAQTDLSKENETSLGSRYRYEVSTEENLMEKSRVEVEVKFQILQKSYVETTYSDIILFLMLRSSAKQRITPDFELVSNSGEINSYGNSFTNIFTFKLPSQYYDSFRLYVKAQFIENSRDTTIEVIDAYNFVSSKSLLENSNSGSSIFIRIITTLILACVAIILYWQSQHQFKETNKYDYTRIVLSVLIIMAIISNRANYSIGHALSIIFVIFGVLGFKMIVQLVMESKNFSQEMTEREANAYRAKMENMKIDIIERQPKT